MAEKKISEKKPTVWTGTHLAILSLIIGAVIAFIRLEGKVSTNAKELVRKESELNFEIVGERLKNLELGIRYHVVTHVVQDIKGTMPRVIVDVPAGFKAISAGWSIPKVNGSEEILVRLSQPSNDLSAWEFVIQNKLNTNTSIDVVLFVTAIQTSSVGD